MHLESLISMSLLLFLEQGTLVWTLFYFLSIEIGGDEFSECQTHCNLVTGCSKLFRNGELFLLNFWNKQQVWYIQTHYTDLFISKHFQSKKAFCALSCNIQ